MLTFNLEPDFLLSLPKALHTFANKAIEVYGFVCLMQVYGFVCCRQVQVFTVHISISQFCCIIC